MSVDGEREREIEGRWGGWIATFARVFGEAPTAPLFFFVITLKPRVEWYKSL